MNFNKIVIFRFNDNWRCRSFRRFWIMLCNQITYDLFSKVEGISSATSIIGTNNGFDFVAKYLRRVVLARWSNLKCTK